jgi:hypothetical protein
VTNAPATTRVDRDSPGFADRTCQFERLVEAAFAKAQGCSGKGMIRSAALALSVSSGKLAAEVACECQAMSVLE